MPQLTIYTAPPLAFATTFLCAMGLPANARADSLQDAFMALPKDKRIAVKQTLSKYEIFVGRVDENWNPGTERALRRGAEEVARRSNSYMRPRLKNQRDVTAYLEKLENGEFADFFQKESASQLWAFLDIFKGG